MPGLGSLISGLIGSAQGEKSIDVSALYDTIKNAGEYQRQIINALPPEIQKNLATYSQSLQGAGAQYQTSMDKQLQGYLQQIQGLYGPTSPAAQAQMGAARQQIYSTVPGTQTAIRNALAATGGLGRGQAGVALAQPYTQAAGLYGQTAANIGAQQTAMGQQATQQALNTINQMEANTFLNLFGMSKEQAQQILTTGNTALQNQLSALINQSNNQTNQTLGVQGIQAQNAYQNALQQQGYQNAIYGGLGEMAGAGINYGMGQLPGFLSGLGTGTGFNPSTMSTPPGGVMQYAPAAIAGL